MVAKKYQKAVSAVQHNTMLHTHNQNDNQWYVGHIKRSGTKYILLFFWIYNFLNFLFFLFLWNGTTYGHEILYVNIDLVPHVQEKKGIFLCTRNIQRVNRCRYTHAYKSLTLLFLIRSSHFHFHIVLYETDNHMKDWICMLQVSLNF